MSEVMKQLHNDHIHVARLLDWLEYQLDRFQQGGVPDYARMLDTMHYMTHYSDMFHHPREDMIFEKMAAKDDSVAEVVERLRAEHVKLGHLGARFQQTLEYICEDVILPREKVEADGREYIALLREHLNTEEGQVFPKAEELLDGRHWAAVDRHMGFQHDPMFGPEVEERYAALYQQISDRQRAEA
jgi:hemerythrin-like domain-containing protein